MKLIICSSPRSSRSCSGVSSDIFRISISDDASLRTSASAIEHNDAPSAGSSTKSSLFALFDRRLTYDLNFASEVKMLDVS